MASHILYQNSDATVTILDIPRSIEQTQGDSSSSRRIISSKPLENPYPSIEPKSLKARSKFPQDSIEDLLLQKHLHFILQGIREAYRGEWCLPRVVGKSDGRKNGKKRKRKDRLREDMKENFYETPATFGSQKRELESKNLKPSLIKNVHHFHNPTSSPIYTKPTPNSQLIQIPPYSTALSGEITTTLQTFTSLAPTFSLIILDPPWPNRSARRKNSYTLSYSTLSIRSLLSSIPVQDYLVERGLVAVWITNKAAFRELLTGEGGIFEEWNVELAEEWVWVKVTRDGETICGLDSVWRKPYEVLLIARKKKKDGEEEGNRGMKRRVIAGVPDLHSRKPNLKDLFEVMMGTEGRKYDALEVFARNLTAGWWSWGNEVFKFQMDEYWVEKSSNLTLE